MNCIQSNKYWDDLLRFRQVKCDAFYCHFTAQFYGGYVWDVKSITTAWQLAFNHGISSKMRGKFALLFMLLDLKSAYSLHFKRDTSHFLCKDLQTFNPTEEWKETLTFKSKFYPFGIFWAIKKLCHFSQRLFGQTYGANIVKQCQFFQRFLLKYNVMFVTFKAWIFTVNLPVLYIY